MRRRGGRILRAQVRYRGNAKLESQKELEQKFRKWQAGNLPANEGTFSILVWGKGRHRNPKSVRRLKLGQFGQVKIYGDRYTTLSDIDRKKPPTLERVFRVSHVVGLGVSWVRIDRSSSERWHLVIRWRRAMSRSQIVALQLLMGSDWRREMFNFYRVLSGIRSRRWNFLFEEKLK